MRCATTNLRLALIPGVLGLTGCAAQVAVGDPNVMLMPRGHGLVASSVVFQSTNDPAYAKFNHADTVFTLTYESMAAGTKEYFFITSGSGATAKSKHPRSTADDSPPVLLLSPAKPGKYKLRDVRIIASPFNNPFSFRVTNLAPIEVTAGQVTYAGSMRLHNSSRWVVGRLTAGSYYLRQLDDFKTDIAELKGMEPRLSRVEVTNGLAN